jgi:adenylate cyclase
VTEPDVRRKLIAILSADVEGYSRLMADDEAATVHTLTAYREVMTRLIQEHRGRVVDCPGDNLLAEFVSVVDAVRCAVEIQEDLRTRNAQLPETRRMRFRIGVNLGDVIEEEDRIYGDGVNIAARLESLAEGGGVCISGSAYEQVENKLALGFDYRGEQTVKNIRKPIQVYRVEMQQVDATSSGRHEEKQPGSRRWRWAALVAIVFTLLAGIGAFETWKYFPRPSPPSVEIKFEQSQALALPDKPSIAVLPFVNMSGDPEQEYFSDGLTEDLITDLCKIAGLFVISRNSVFLYKGKVVKPEQVSRELGVRYLLEGSVRRAGDRVRITAQLIDATTGGHLWAERYDRDLNDIFAVQDEVTQKIVTALAVKLPDTALSSSGGSGETSEVLPAQGATGRLHPKEADNLRAYDYFWRGRWYSQRFTKEANAQARLMFEKAIELEPEFGSAYAGLGWTHYEDWAMQWSDDPGSLDRAFELARRALTLDVSLSVAHSLLGHVYLWKKQHEEAIGEKEQVITLDPNNADGYADLAEVLVWAGRPGEAIGFVKKAMRLNPHYPVNYLFTLGFAYLTEGQYEEAIKAQKEALTQNPDFLASYMALAATYSELGRMGEAQAHVAEGLKINPHLSLEVWRERLPFKDPIQLDRFVTAMRNAGLE